MEDNKNGGYSADGRKLRPRRPRVAKAASFSENGGYHSERRNYQGERNGEDRGYRPRRSDNYSDRPRRGGYGPRREHDESRGNAFADNSSYVTEEDSRGYNRGSYGERRGYGQRSDRTRRSYQDGQRRSYSEVGERRSYSEGGERRSYSASRGPRPAQGKGRGPAPKKNAPRKNAAAEGIKRMISRKPQVHEGENVESFTPLAKDEVRLNKFIANSGVCSRREADQMIQAGVVTVNGEVVTELGSKIKPGVDDVRFNGERLKGEEKVYIVMNKPRGYVTSASDPHADKTVMDLLKNCAFRVFPVGRLDKNTTGVLMFTNDGEIAERLTHPSFDKKKIYQVTLNTPLTDEDYQKILSGIILGDGEVKADELEYIDENDHRKLGIEIHSGKNRIVRRIFESLGYDVKALDRVYFAGLTKKGVKKGEWRYLTEGEANVLKMGAYL